MIIYIKTNDQTSTTVHGEKLDTVKKLSKTVSEALGAQSYPVQNLRLIYLGKQLVDSHTLFDYNIKNKATILAYLKSNPDTKTSPQESETEEKKEWILNLQCNDHVLALDLESLLFKHASVISIIPSETHPRKKLEVCFLDSNITNIISDTFVLPLKVTPIGKDEVWNNVPALLIMNQDMSPSQSGSTYALVTISEIPCEKKTNVIVTLKHTQENMTVSTDMLYSVNGAPYLDELATSTLNGAESIENTEKESNSTQEVPYFCKDCENDDSKDCNSCGCFLCGEKDDEAHTLLCEECQMYFHMRCLDPPLKKIPDGDWYCNDCFNDPSNVVKAGERLNLKDSKKNKMPSAKQTKTWGRGMACTGLSKKCTIVPPSHVGPIPGIPVGSSWKYRIHMSEAGVHRPPVAGIAGSEKTQAYSIVLSGGYPEDVDNGDEFTYTGSGGRDLKTGNKRVAAQTFDQELTKVNKALAKTCDAPISGKGAKAKNWKKSKAIRVIRAYKLKKHAPTYAPDDGFRYDGVYKLVKYWPEKGKSGFIVWRYLLRRDDEEPAPWTEAGKKRIQELGLKMYVQESDTKENAGDCERKYFVPKNIKDLISKDKKNKRPWSAILESEPYVDLKQFLEKITEQEFVCPICQMMVQNPVTTPCSHNICQQCMIQTLKSFKNGCPTCRTPLESDFQVKVNPALVNIFKTMLPSYQTNVHQDEEQDADDITDSKIKKKQRCL